MYRRLVVDLPWSPETPIERDPETMCILEGITIQDMLLEGLELAIDKRLNDTDYLKPVFDQLGITDGAEPSKLSE